MLLIELDGNDKETLEKEYEIIGEMCLDNGAIEVYVADNYTTQERVWKVRRNIAEAFMVYSPHQSLEDVVVPISNIPKLLSYVEELSRKYGIPLPCYGHAGDGNIHVTPVKNPEHSLKQWGKILPRVLDDLYDETIRLGGTISGEHGIGHKRKKYLGKALNSKTIELMKKIKLAFDPNNILNPGKIFDI